MKLNFAEFIKSLDGSCKHITCNDCPLSDKSGCTLPEYDAWCRRLNTGLTRV